MGLAQVAFAAIIPLHQVMPGKKRRRSSESAESSDSEVSIASEPALSPAAKRRKREKYKKQARESADILPIEFFAHHDELPLHSDDGTPAASAA